MPLLDSIDRISFAKIVSLAVFLSLLFGVPATVLLVQRQTRIESRAYKKPEVMVAEKSSPGPAPKEAPFIGRIFPWVGKAGDIIWIQGSNFGVNPVGKSLIVAGVQVGDEEIAGWRDDLIQAVIPAGAAQGGVVEVKIGSHPVARSLPIVIYDRQTRTKLKKKGDQISAFNVGQAVSYRGWMGDENIPTEFLEGQITNSPGEEVFVMDTQSKPILTLLLFDRQGAVLPYYVDPAEFGF